METDTKHNNSVEYNSVQGKLFASVRWLIARVYDQGNIPDLLQNIVNLQYNEESKDSCALSNTVITALANGSLYSQAAAKILKNSSLVNASPGSLLHVLTQYGIDVCCENGYMLTEEQLIQQNSFDASPHLAMIDGLMTAEVNSLITIERVVTAISQYVNVEQNELPLDSVDALLFWINKICCIIRDHVETQNIPLNSKNENTTIPEMEDLYEDFQDGTCIATVVNFYKPELLDFNSIIFNDFNTDAESYFNLQLLKNFCQALPKNIFHFEIEDLLILPECMQINLNVFLAELFDILEEPPIQSLPPSVPETPVRRRFVDVQPIPGLRPHLDYHPPQRVNDKVYANVQRGMKNFNEPRANSMISADSLAYPRNNNQIYRQTLPPGVLTTNFSSITQQNNSSNNEQSNCYTDEYNNSSSMENSLTQQNNTISRSANIRLALEEKRREFNKNRAIQSNAIEEKSLKTGKDAFFKLTSRNQTQDLSPSNGVQRARTMSEIGILQNQNSQPMNMSNNNNNNQGSQLYMNQSGISAESEQIRQLQEQLRNVQIALNQATLQQNNEPNYGIQSNTLPRNLSQPSIYNANDIYLHNMNNPYGTLQHQRSPQLQQQPYGMITPHNQYSSQGRLSQLDPRLSQGPYATPFPPHQQQRQFYQQGILDTPQNMYLQQQQPYPVSINTTSPQFYMNQTSLPSPPAYPGAAIDIAAINSNINGPQEMFQNTYPSNQGVPISSDDLTSPNSFRLHNPNAVGSRLDPSLELNKSLTNWGMTYKSDQKPRRRQWANQNRPSGTSTKSEHDIVHLPDNTIVETKNDYDNDTSNKEENDNVINDNDDLSKHQSPPRDPTSTNDKENSKKHNNESPVKLMKSASLKQVVSGEAFDFVSPDNNEITDEMKAKRDAFIKAQMKRKEKVAAKAEELDAKLEEKRQKEIAKQELAEQRKIEAEIRRQKALENYKKRKAEKESGEMGRSMSGSISARSGLGASQISLNRGKSQPPIGRPASQNTEMTSTVAQRKGSRNQLVTDDSGQQKIFVASIQEPTLKLFAKKAPKSNRGLIVNALNFSVFPGAVWNEQRTKVQGALAQSDSKHFLVLFRDQKCQYRGLYRWDEVSDTVYRLDGTGPKIIKESMMNLMFKYDSGAKSFTIIPSKHLSATIDAFSLQDQYWQRAKIPHSSNTVR
uniref:Patronin (inferred by orthology to a D. melanogaster protein) n=1 Tax=Strongyloides venezuelensis TaxID=75913 RepID=A0A0K0EUV5_STRVS